MGMIEDCEARAVIYCQSLLFESFGHEEYGVESLDGKGEEDDRLWRPDSTTLKTFSAHPTS